MAKYCSKCGKALPKGVDLCPDCHKMPEAGSDAAPFTMMSAETEVWKDKSENTARKIKPAKQISAAAQKRAIIIACCALVIIAAAAAFVLTRPTLRVVFALRNDNYENALKIYEEKLSGSESLPGAVEKQLLKNGEELYDALYAGTISGADGEMNFAMLRSFGTGSEELDALYGKFSALKISQDNSNSAAAAAAAGEYLKACELYAKVIEEDPEYAKAQESISACLDAYVQSVVAEVNALVLVDDYAAGVKLLKEAEAELLEWGTFSEKIDAELDNSYSLYEAFMLKESKTLADAEDYKGAAQLLEDFMAEQNYGTESLLSAVERYKEQADNKIIKEAVALSDSLYDEEKYYAAFVELEEAAKLLMDAKGMDTAINALEKRYTIDVLDKAEKAFDGDRYKLSDAIAITEEALEIRELDEIAEYDEYLRSIKILNLGYAEYSSRDGIIYRNSNDFETVGGDVYENGWIWGEDGAEVEFKLNSKYNVFHGFFATRRDDDEDVNGYFEVYCDDELVFTSQTLSHYSEIEEFEVDVTDVKMMKIVFHCNYNTSTAEDGFCYHGICQPYITKNMK